MVRPIRRDLLDRDLIIAIDANVDRRLQLADPLHEVVRERVIIIDQHDHATTGALRENPVNPPPFQPFSWGAGVSPVSGDGVHSGVG